MISIQDSIANLMQSQFSLTKGTDLYAKNIFPNKPSPATLILVDDTTGIPPQLIRSRISIFSRASTKAVPSDLMDEVTKYFNELQEDVLDNYILNRSIVAFGPREHPDVDAVGGVKVYTFFANFIFYYEER